MAVNKDQPEVKKDMEPTGSQIGLSSRYSDSHLLCKGQPSYDEYEEAKRLVDRRVKQRKRELLKQTERGYDVAAPVGYFHTVECRFSMSHANSANLLQQYLQRLAT